MNPGRTICHAIHLFCISSFSYLFFYTIQELLDSVPAKTDRFHGTEFFVKDIFSDNHNWGRYYHFHKREIRPVEQKEVAKMLNSKSPARGCFVYHCTECGFDKSGKFINEKVNPYVALRRMWLYQVLTNLKKASPKKTKDCEALWSYVLKVCSNAY